MVTVKSLLVVRLTVRAPTLTRVFAIASDVDGDLECSLNAPGRDSAELKAGLVHALVGLGEAVIDDVRDTGRDELN